MVDDPRSGDVVERLVPRRRHQLASGGAHHRHVEPAGIVVELGPGAALRARVALRPRIVGIALEAHDASAVELDDRPAPDGADATGRPGFGDLAHQRSLPGDRSSGTWYGRLTTPEPRPIRCVR
jgi:hypothetical protein